MRTWRNENERGKIIFLGHTRAYYPTYIGMNILLFSRPFAQHIITMQIARNAVSVEILRFYYAYFHSSRSATKHKFSLIPAAAAAAALDTHRTMLMNEAHFSQGLLKHCFVPVIHVINIPES